MNKNTAFNFSTTTTSAQRSLFPINQYKNTKGQREFIMQGIHSLEEYDLLSKLDIYPLNLLSSEAKNDFREGLVFVGSSLKPILAGWRRGVAYKELSNIQYVHLIQLLAGINPVGPSYFIYKPNPSFPDYECHQNFTPCYQDPIPCFCKIFYNQECCFIGVQQGNGASTL